MLRPAALPTNRLFLLAAPLLAVLSFAAQAQGAHPLQAPSSPPAPAPADNGLDGLRQDIWTLYSASSIVGTDGRGRTISDDLRDFVLTPNTLDHLATLRTSSAGTLGYGADPAAAGDAAEVLRNERAHLNFISTYWMDTVRFRHHEALLRALVDRLPAESTRGSMQVIRAATDARTACMQPPFDAGQLSDADNALTEAYNRERQALSRLLGAQQQRDAAPRRLRIRQRDCPAPATKTSGRSAPIQTPWNLSDDAYPRSARRDGVRGRVVLQIAVDAGGCVTRSEIVTTSGAPELDDAAQDAIELVRFLPAEKGGHAVASTAQVPWDFNLR
jgi:protein TonB